MPKKFEAGTTAFADIIALGSLIDYVQEIGIDNIKEYELKFLDYAIQKLSQIKEVRILGSASEKEPVVSITIDGVDVKKFEKYLNDEIGIAVKAGQLSSQALMKQLNIPGAQRASFAWYNTKEEIDALVEGIQA